MNKAEIRALEKVFVAEVDGRLPFQSRARIYFDLAENGMVSHETITLHGSFPVRLKGWVLTHLGRMTYCETCADEGGFDEDVR